MKEVEKVLNKEKNDIDRIQVPEELEERLCRALKNHKPFKRRKRYWKTRIAAAFIAILLIGYNIDTLAFYGKRIMGYDQVMSGTLKELNELGKGQMIDKSYTFENGVKVTLDAIMIDENQLLAFYTIEDPNGNVDDYMPMMEIKGLFRTYLFQGGQGQRNEENTIMKNLHSFEPPLFFEKTMDLKLRLMKNRIIKEGEITFKIDREKAMGHTLKKTINRTIEVDKTNIRFESILASPTSTVIKGSIQNILELARDHVRGERMMPNHMKVRLIANGEEINPLGSGMSTDLSGITFHHEYDALPKDLESLELLIESFAADHNVNETIDIRKDTSNKTVNIHNQEIKINRVYESNGNAFITITTEENTVLTKVSLIVDGEKIELESTTADKFNKSVEEGITHTRTLKFPKAGETYGLSIERIRYSKDYNKSIDIPID